MATLRLKGIPSRITKNDISELYPANLSVSLARTESSPRNRSQTATVTFPNPKAAEKILENNPPLRIGEEEILVDGDFDGMTVLFSGLDSGAVVDIIAVHGLNGHAFNTWAMKKTNVMWLRDFLPRQIPEARIMTYGYNSKVSDSIANGSFRDFSVALLNSIDLIRTKEEGTRPIVFICHSLGGIVVKQALNLARVEPRHRVINQVTTGIVFLATPHQGSPIADYGAILGMVAKISKLREELVKGLRSSSRTLTVIASEFRQHHDSIQIGSFFEGRGIKIGLFSKIVVDQNSAALGLQHEEQSPLDKDHREICRFEHQETEDYKLVYKQIRKMVDAASTVAGSRLRQEGGRLTDPRPAYERAPQKNPNLVARANTGCETTGLHFLVPYSRNPGFTGRKDVVEQIMDIWASGRGNHQRIALFGLGGIGKTQIAIECAYRCKELPSKERPSVFWVHAGNHELFVKHYRQIFRIAKPLEDENLKDDVLLDSTKDWLESPESGDWVLILDNADNLHQFFHKTTAAPHDEIPEGEKLSRFIPQGHKGTVIVTTRDRQVAEKVAEVRSLRIGVSNMTEQEGIHLFQEKGVEAKTPEDEKALRELLKEIEYLPLAIAQAAAYISNVDDITISRYLDMFNKDTVDFLSEEFSDGRRGPGSKNAVLKAWLISFEQIQTQCPLAANLLTLTAFLDRQAIPEELLKSSGFEGADNNKRFIDAIRKLMAFSLIARSSNETYEVHRLVHLATYESLVRGERKKWAVQALGLLSRVFPEGSHDNRRICEAYLPHALAAIKHSSLDDVNDTDLTNVQAPIPDVKVADVFLLSHHVGGFLDYQGRYKHAEEYLRVSLNGREKVLRPEHPDTLESLDNLASVLARQGKYSEAEEMNRRALDGYEKVLGPEHPYTLMSLDNLASVLENQGKHSEAEGVNRRALDGYEKVLGPEHPDTLISLSNLALVLANQGKYSEAEEMNRRALGGREKVLGPEHPDTLISLNNLAWVLEKQDKHSEAAEVRQRLSERKKKPPG